MNKIKNLKWRVNNSYDNSCAIEEISQGLGISRALSTVIYNRGYKNINDAEAFLNKSQGILHDPFLLNDMDKAVERILTALKNNEKITIYGDFDADGVTSVSIMYLYLSRMGACVDYYVPSRQTEGYGVSSYAIEKISQGGTSLIITVDTGITAVTEVEFAKSLGIDFVVTDHHECTDVLPDAIAVINPKRLDSTYPFSGLAGVGVAFKLLCALESRLLGCNMMDAVRNVANQYADLTAIGTIADVMPVIDENRLLIAIGLMKAENTDKIGLATLMDYCRNGEGKSNSKSNQRKKVSSSFVSYALAPRINAAGRILSASLAIDLFITDDKNIATDYSLKLCEINRDRQAAENKIANEAYEQIESNNLGDDFMIILDDSQWLFGVVGIVSSRVTEKYGVPSILITFESNDDPEDMEAIGKGSGRSIPGMNIVDALQSCIDLLEKFGGHELAAGLSIKRKNLPEFKRRMKEFAFKSFGGVLPEHIIDIDCELESHEITLDLAKELSYLEPCGSENSAPLFAVRNAVITDIIPLKMNRHLKLIFLKDNYEISAMLFSTAPQELKLTVGDEVDFAFYLDVNEYNGTSSTSLSIKDIRLSERSLHFECVNEEIYLCVKNGESDLAPDYIVPEREDFADVYNCLLSNARMGQEKLRYSKLLSYVLSQKSNTKVNYVKLKYIIKVFRELNIVSIEEIDSNTFTFHIAFSKTKTNLEKSCILKKLKSMYPKR